MSNTKNHFYTFKKLEKLKNKLFIFSGGRCRGKMLLSKIWADELSRKGYTVITIRKTKPYALKIKASRKKFKRRRVVK